MCHKNLLQHMSDGSALDWPAVQAFFNTNPAALEIPDSAKEITEEYTYHVSKSFNIDRKPDVATTAKVCTGLTSACTIFN